MKVSMIFRKILSGMKKKKKIERGVTLFMWFSEMNIRLELEWFPNFINWVEHAS